MAKMIMFMAWMWLIVSIAGGIYQGSTVTMVATTLETAIDDSATTLTVSSTNGFPTTGTIVIGDERIAYADTTANTFEGNPAQPLIRGSSSTEAVSHEAGETIRTVESSMFNASMGYRLAVLSDASGVLAFVAIPFAFLSLIASFFTLPLAFMGTDFQILVYIWGVLSIGVIVGIAISLAGGRRV